MIGRRLQRPERERSWRETSLLAVDFEATGADPRTAEPLSVAWVPVERGRVRLDGAGYALIRHDGPVARESIAVHGILPNDVAAAHHSAEVGEALSTAFDDRLLVAHGAQLEVSLLARLGVAADRRRTVDTMSLIRRLDALEERRDRGRLDLAAVTDRFGIRAGAAHHAFADALATAMLLLVLATKFERYGSHTAGDLLRIGRPA